MSRPPKSRPSSSAFRMREDTSCSYYPAAGSHEFPMIEGAFDELDSVDEDDSPDESP